MARVLFVVLLVVFAGVSVASLCFAGGPAVDVITVNGTAGIGSRIDVGGEHFVYSGVANGVCVLTRVVRTGFSGTSIPLYMASGTSMEIGDAVLRINSCNNASVEYTVTYRVDRVAVLLVPVALSLMITLAVVSGYFGARGADDVFPGLAETLAGVVAVMAFYVYLAYRWPVLAVLGIPVAGIQLAVITLRVMHGNKHVLSGEK